MAGTHPQASKKKHVQRMVRIYKNLVSNAKVHDIKFLCLLNCCSSQLVTCSVAICTGSRAVGKHTVPFAETTLQLPRATLYDIPHDKVRIS
jgi:hypothetical protein